MPWASKRKTTRVEDLACCLMGIFDIHIPMIYGEGIKAFLRLQEEMAKQSCDLSLFSWRADPGVKQSEGYEYDEPSSMDRLFRGLFARSPLEFLHYGKMKLRNSGGLLDKEFTVTNKGLRIETSLIESSSLKEVAPILNLGVCEMVQNNAATPEVPGGCIGVFVMKTAVGFLRYAPYKVYVAGDDTRHASPTEIIHIRKDVSANQQASLNAVFNRCVIVETGDNVVLEIVKAMPRELWDPRVKAFLGQDDINAYVRFDVRYPGNYGFVEKFPAILGCSTFGELICHVWTPQDNLFQEVEEYMEQRMEVFDYVWADYLRLRFLKGFRPQTQATGYYRQNLKPVEGIHAGKEGGSATGKRRRDVKVAITATIKLSQAGGLSRYFLKVRVT